METVLDKQLIGTSEIQNCLKYIKANSTKIDENTIVKLTTLGRDTWALVTLLTLSPKNSLIIDSRILDC